MPALHEVFGVSASIPQYTYVDRSGLDNRFKYSLLRDAHIVLHGGSKQGKTVLRRANLPEDKSSVVQCRASTTCTNIYEQILADVGASVPTSATTKASTSKEVEAKGGISVGVPLLKGEGGVATTFNTKGGTDSTSLVVGAGADSLAFVGKAILQSGKRPIIEDFHYMPEEEKKVLSFDLKALWDMRVFFIIVGIWAEQNLLPYYNGDLSGRIDEIDVQWSNGELEEVLAKGEKALNIVIVPEIRQQIISDASQNVGLLQRIAEKFCIHSGIFGTVEASLVSSVGDSVRPKCRQL
jgi:hypothetical protein